MAHSFRTSLEDEFEAVIADGLDTSHTVLEQLGSYHRTHAAVLRKRPIFGAILARRHLEPACIEVMERWYAHVLRYSRRDQLSLPVALSGLSAQFLNIVQDDIRASEHHRWPTVNYKRPLRYFEELYPSDEALGLLGRLVRERDAAANERDLALAARQAIEQSRIWRSTAWYRNMRDRLRRRHEYVRRGTARASVQAMGALGVDDALSKLRARITASAQTAPVFGNDARSGLFFVEDRIHGRLYVSDQKRLELYLGGIGARLHWILRDYRIPDTLLRPGDTMVDVGANSGELGWWVAGRGGHYVAFEPDPAAFLALKANHPDQLLFDLALSNVEGTAMFHLDTAEADSSHFKPSSPKRGIEVRVGTLDGALSGVDLAQSIRLLKVEAEGMEPEVLMGAVETLHRTDYVAVDAGPERGGENTVPDVLRILTRAGFEVTAANLERGTFLLECRLRSRPSPTMGETTHTP